MRRSARPTRADRALGDDRRPDLDREGLASAEDFFDPLLLAEDFRQTLLPLDLLDPNLVKFQFQMSTTTAGLVAADYFARYPGRFSSMHLQANDMYAPAPAGEGKRAGLRPQVALDRGSIDWAVTFGAARLGGVGSYFVEQTWDLTQQSVAYLKTLQA